MERRRTQTNAFPQVTHGINRGSECVEHPVECVLSTEVVVARESRREVADQGDDFVVHQPVKPIINAFIISHR